MPPGSSAPNRAISAGRSSAPIDRARSKVVGRQQCGGDDPDDLELEPVGILRVEALGGAVVAGTDERAAFAQAGGQALEFAEGVHLPGEVIQTDRRAAGLGRSGVGADLEHAEIVVVGRVGCLQERRAGRRHDDPESEDVAVELRRPLDVTDVQHCVVETLDCHGRPKPVCGRKYSRVGRGRRAPHAETRRVPEWPVRDNVRMATGTAPSGTRWRALGALLRPDAWRWAGLGVLVAIGSGLLIAGPLIVRRIIDEATDGATSTQIAQLAVLYLVVAVVAQVLAVVVVWLATIAAWRTTNELRLTMTRHVLGLDHEFHRTHTPGELIQRVDGDVTSVSDFLSRVVTKAFGSAVLVGGIIIVLTVIDWRLGLGMALYVGLSVMVVVRTRHRAVSESSDEMGALGRLYGGIEERLTAAEDLRANGAGDHVAWRFVEDSEDALMSAVRRERAFLVMWWFVQGAVAAGWIVALVLGAVLVAAGTITIGTAFLLFQFVLLIARPLEELVHELETVQKANGAMVRVIDLLAVEPKVLDEGTTSPPPGPLSIDAVDVAFDYGDDRAVLRDVDVHIGAGRSVGIVGRTGSGKTTFSRLVLRLVEPTEGHVALGGVAIADIPVPELRRRVALVPQEVELFAGQCARQRHAVRRRTDR